MRIEATPAELRAFLCPKRIKMPAVTRQKTSGGPVILMARTAYEHGMRDLGGREPEAGGLLVGPKGHRSVTHFVPDSSGTSRPDSFTWDHASLNLILRRYRELGLDAKGFWHSHPPGFDRLSDGDLAFVRRVVLTPGNDVEEVLMPVYEAGTCHPFIVYPDLRAVRARLVIF